MNPAAVNDEVARFIAASLIVLDVDTQQRPVLLLLDAPVSFHPNGGWSRQLAPRPHWMDIVGRNRDSLFALKEAEIAASRMWEENMPRMPELRDGDRLVESPSFEQAKRFYLDELLMILIEYLEKAELIQLAVSAVGDLRFDRGVVDAVLSRHNHTWQATQFMRSVVVPILNFESQLEQINFTDNLRIRRMSNEEKAAFWSPMDSNLSAYHIPQLQEVSFLAEANYVAPRAIGSSTIMIPSLKQLLTALRLAQGGDVGALAFRDTLLPSFVSRSYASGQLPDYWLPTDIRPPRYVLNTDAATSVLELFGLLTRAKANGRISDLDTSLRRFNQHYSRRFDEDKILDLTIVLESTLLFGDNNELSYKVALRGAALLKDQVPPADVFRLLRDLYKARSAIVHNGLDSRAIEKKGYTAGMSVGDFVTAVAQCVRIVLARYLQAIDIGGSVRKVTESLDSVLVTQLQPDIT
ncbi:MAG TPA: hypothetical protein VFT45_06970 [Longimicrobium sp.]|nr:hypothetical protein [Longimicrobium sp.]